MSSLQATTAHVRDLFYGMASHFDLKAASSVTVPLAGFLFGSDNFLTLQALLVLVGIDFVTGLVSAKVSREAITSRKGVKSAFKVGVYGLLVSAAHLTETITPGTTFMVEAMTTFLALTEMISILENAGRMGFAVPRRLLNQLHRLRDEESVTREVATTHILEDNVGNTVETHRVVEKVEERKVTEKPPEPLG